MMYKNRTEAAQELVKKLKTYRSENPIVLAASREGVEIGFVIAVDLNCDFSMIIARKLGYPKRPETAFGALAEDGSLYLSSERKEKISSDEIYKVMDKVEHEIKQSVKKYRTGNPIPKLENRLVILVDDDIITGSSLFAAIQLCKKRSAKKIVVSAPVSNNKMYEMFSRKADEVIVTKISDDLFYGKKIYEDFNRISDEDISRYLMLLNLRSRLKDTGIVLC